MRNTELSASFAVAAFTALCLPARAVLTALQSSALAKTLGYMKGSMHPGYAQPHPLVSSIKCTQTSTSDLVLFWKVTEKVEL